jgi:hypothetical protein
MVVSIRAARWTALGQHSWRPLQQQRTSTCRYKGTMLQITRMSISNVTIAGAAGGSTFTRLVLRLQNQSVRQQLLVSCPAWLQ